MSGRRKDHGPFSIANEIVDIIYQCLTDRLLGWKKILKTIRRIQNVTGRKREVDPETLQYY